MVKLRHIALAFAILMASATQSFAESAPTSIGHAATGPFEKAACYVFGGRIDCRTVRVFDAEACIVKIHPNPLPDIEPSSLACLRDEVQTKKLHLRKALPRNLNLSDRIYVAGQNVVEVLVRFDKHGAAIWESINSDTFELKGDKARARQMVRKISSQFCVGPSRMVGGGTSGGVIEPKEAFRRATEGSIALVDIRHPSEWRRTGVGVNANAITMHQSIYRFVDQLKKVAGAGDRPIALICAEGVRSSTMQKSLMEFGFKGVIDVREGMEGGAKGPGWIKSGLPVAPYRTERAELTR